MRKLCHRTLLAFVASVALVALAGSAGAQPAEPAADGPYTSAMRAQCEAELAKDKRWSAELSDSLRPSVHQADTNLMMTNKKHVVMAYAALWVCAVVFVVLLWLRQQKLSAEIARLEADLKKAAAQ